MEAGQRHDASYERRGLPVLVLVCKKLWYNARSDLVKHLPKKYAAQGAYDGTKIIHWI